MLLPGGGIGIIQLSLGFHALRALGAWWLRGAGADLENQAVSWLHPDEPCRALL